MLTAALEAAFKAKLITYAQSEEIAVDWGDRKTYNPVKEGWLRPRLNPSPTKPGPTEKGPLRGELKGFYSVECFLPIEQKIEAVLQLADDIGQHFLPDWAEPGYVESDDCVIHITAPSIDRLPPTDSFNRAVAHIPYRVYARAA